jgi:undecaprenyl diphosphate synthase
MSSVSMVPRHIAIVMDGNGRWATQKFLPRIAGHKQGVEALKRMVTACAHRGVSTLTVFAFSSENWNRPKDEVSGLMDLLFKALSREVDQLHRDGVRLRFIGSRADLATRMQEGLHAAEALTADNQALNLNVCFNYGGRWDIADAAARLAQSDTPITVDTLSQNISTAACGDPDLLIRTGGEMRLSNFLLWQAAYAELFFSELLWPDFDEVALDAAIAEFASRERRFGKTTQQIADIGMAQK